VIAKRLLNMGKNIFAGKVETKEDVSERRALILALGEYPGAPAKKEQIVTMFLSWYRTDKYPGIHGAVDWILRKKWNSSETLERIDCELASRDPVSNIDWYVNCRGQTLTVVRGPVCFKMGTEKAADADPESDEVQHTVKIDRSFAIATKEVTIRD